MTVTKGLMFRAMLRTGGDREAAAKSIEMSTRSFYRYIDKFDLGEVFRRCGWQKRVGPPRGRRLYEMEKEVIVRYIRTSGGVIDPAQLAVEVFGEDLPEHRRRTSRLLDDLMRLGRVTRDAFGKFTVVSA